MKKYKYSRKEWVMEFSKWLGFDDKFAEFDQDAKDERKWLRDLLATKETKSDKEREWTPPIYTKECLDVWGPPKESKPKIEPPKPFIVYDEDSAELKIAKVNRDKIIEVINHLNK